METSVSIQQKEIPDSAAVQLTWLPQSLGVAAVTMGQTFSTLACSRTFQSGAEDPGFGFVSE